MVLLFLKSVSVLTMLFIIYMFFFSVSFFKARYDRIPSTLWEFLKRTDLFSYNYDDDFENDRIVKPAMI